MERLLKIINYDTNNRYREIEAETDDDSEIEQECDEESSEEGSAATIKRCNRCNIKDPPAYFALWTQDRIEWF